MKRIFICIVFISLLCHSVSAQQTTTAAAVNLDTALKNTVGYFAGRLPVGSRVAVLNITSKTPELSDYIINEMTMHFFNNGNFMMVDRQNLDAIRKEMDIQYSGEVSDESMVSIGKRLGVQTIISGNITQAGSTYRLQVRAIAVETAAIQGMQSSSVVIDRMMASLTGTPLTQAMIDEDNLRQQEEKMKLDGKNVFAFSLSTAYLPVYGFSLGTNITVFEKHNKKIAPSVFITFKWMYLWTDSFDFKDDIDGIDSMKLRSWEDNMLNMSLFSLGGGVLFKYNVTDRFILNAGPSLEYIFGFVSDDGDSMSYSTAKEQEENEGYSSLGLGVQAGFQFRVSPSVSLDVNGILKFAFSSGEYKKIEEIYWSNKSYTLTKTYTPFIFGIEIGMTFMFPYVWK